MCLMQKISTQTHCTNMFYYYFTYKKHPMLFCVVIFFGLWTLSHSLDTVGRMWSVLDLSNVVNWNSVVNKNNHLSGRLSSFLMKEKTADCMLTTGEWKDGFIRRDFFCTLRPPESYNMWGTKNSEAVRRTWLSNAVIIDSAAPFSDLPQQIYMVHTTFLPPSLRLFA